MRKSDVELTDSKVAKLKVTGKKVNVWDRRCPGFGVEVKPTGTKILVVKTCITVGGVRRRQWHTLGTWPMKNVEEARIEASLIKDQVRKGEDPKAVLIARREAVRVDALLDRYYSDVLQVKAAWVDGKLVVTRTGKDGAIEKIQGSGKERVRICEKFIRPVIGAMAVRDVGTAHLDSLLFKIQKRTPVQANRVQTVLSRVFGKAEVWEMRPAGSNPVQSQERTKEGKRERNLSDREIVQLGKALKTVASVDPKIKSKPGQTRYEGPYVLAAIRLAVLSGMRKGEVLGLRWEWVDLEEEEIRIPPEFHKTGKKTKRTRVVRLCAAAQELLGRLPRALGNPYVIVGDKIGEHLVDLQHPWERIREVAGLAVDGMPNEDDPGLHDLRRTFASVAARMKVPELFIAALLGHSAGTVTQGYARVSQDPLRETVEDIGARIAGLLDGTIDLAAEEKEAMARKKAKGQPAC